MGYWRSIRDKVGNLNLLRPYWRCYYEKTNAILFAIDSSDKERIEIAKHELLLLLEEDELKGVPIAILANKQDVKGCLSDIEVRKYIN